MAKVQTSFNAASSGFEFVNFFEAKLPLKFQLPLVGNVDLNDIVFGLCGGMSYAVLDYFYAGQSLPQYASSQEIELPLMTYLIERQVDSLSIPTLLKIIDWASHGNDELARRMLRTELPRLRRQLDKGDPAVLCLIRTEGIGNLTQNHQVVATGYDLDVLPGSIVLTLYDPNHPRATPTITLSLSAQGFQIAQSTGEPLRGVFLMPYTRRKKNLPKVSGPLPGFAFAAPEMAEAAPELPFHLRWPVDSRMVNQRFGENPKMYRPFGLAGHEGIDFFAPTGARVYAAFEGTVTEAKVRGAYGRQVRIRHEHNGVRFTTVYAHLEKSLVEANQQVAAGDLIGLADNTGNSHGSHLHFTLFIDGKKTAGYYDGIVDPWLYFEGNEPPPPPELSNVVVYTVREVNLRELPTTDSAILTLLPAGESLPVFGKDEEIRPKIGRDHQWLQVKTGSGAVGFVAAWLVQDVAQQVFPPSGLIVYPFDTLKIFLGAGLGMAVLGTVSSQTPLNVLGNAESSRSKIGQKDEWLQVLAPGGTSGFIPAWLVRLTGDVPPATGLFVTPTVNLNLRAAPHTGSDVLAVLVPGDTFKVLGDKAQESAKIGLQDQWINVQAPNGVTGWTAAWLVTAQGSAPVEEEKPTLPVQTSTVYPTADVGINLRASPDVDAMRVDGALFNEPLTLLDANLPAALAKIGQMDQWLYVERANGKRGWAAAWFLSAAPQPV